MKSQNRQPTSPADYDQNGLGALPSTATAGQLYLDMVKRAVANILYEDPPIHFYDGQGDPVLAQGFDLKRRVWGEDAPTRAHTMIGIRRLDNIAQCVENILAEGVPGDVLEAGVLRGGGAIFLAACLKAHGALDRRVFVCDTFQPPKPLSWPVKLFLRAIAHLPGIGLQRRLFHLGQSLAKDKSFPDLRQPSDQMMRFVMWAGRHLNRLDPLKGGGLDQVKSNFARYGLLSDQVVFLKGMFAETFPTAPFTRLALIRLDGDTYESTRDCLVHLYPRLSPGGYCIIDDYHSFPDCQQAVSEYREQNGIHDEITAIDRLAVFWKKS
jgi:Macrocin-O-methyltransferase (TylF)